MSRRRTICWDDAEAARPGSLTAEALGYLDHLLLRQSSPATIRAARTELHRFVCWLHERGVTDLAQVALRHLEAYQRHAVHHRKADGAALSIRTQIQRLHRVQLWCAWATRTHRLPANPAADLMLPRAIVTIPAYLTPTEVAAVFAQPNTATAVGLRDRTMLEVFYSTGMRRLELSRLACDDIDARAGLVRIRQGKGRKDRLIPIGRRALHWLASYHTDARPALLAGCRDDGDAAGQRRLFLSHRHGLPLHEDAIGTIVRNYLTAAGIDKPGSCHLFRHTAATHLLQAGCDVRLIQELLGHADLGTTAGYTRVAIGHLQRAHATYHPAEQGLSALPSADAAAEASPAAGLAAAERAALPS
jgi:integrase/recombinase XerD